MVNRCQRLIGGIPCRLKNMVCHCARECKNCGKSFTNRSTYYAHIAKCVDTDQRQPDVVHIKVETQVATQIHLQKDNLLISLDAQSSEGQHSELKQQIEQICKQFLQSRQPKEFADPSSNQFNIDLTNYRSMGEDIYTQLIDKMGNAEAIEYIKNAVARRRPMDLFRKLYLEDVEYKMYPLTSRAHDMRYVDHRRILVSDENGHLLAFMIQESIQNALLKTAAALVNQKIMFERQSKGECSEGNQCCDDFFEVQQAALDIKRRLPRTDIIKILKEWTEQSQEEHPFFANPVCVKATERHHVTDSQRTT